MKIPEEGSDPNNPVRIYTDGVFDCFHYGHAKGLQQIKQMFPYVYLIVGLSSDEVVTKEKWKPIMSYEERIESLKHCKYVDEILTNAPWEFSIEFLDSINCKYVAREPTPYPCGDVKDIYAPFKECGRFLSTKRIDYISTTNIIGRVLRNYDLFLERNIRRGEKWEELNISLYKYFGIKIGIIIKNIEKRKKTNYKKFYFDKWKFKLELVK